MMFKTNGGIPEYDDRHAKHEESKKSRYCTDRSSARSNVKTEVTTRSRKWRFPASLLSRERLLSPYAPNRIASPVKPMFKRSYLSS
jgi:hypothetical protein